MQTSFLARAIEKEKERKAAQKKQTSSIKKKNPDCGYWYTPSYQNRKNNSSSKED